MSVWRRRGICRFRRDRDAEEKFSTGSATRRTREDYHCDIVANGFDAPILQTMYPGKPLRDYLPQAICRTNRPLGEQKTHGLIVDYLTFDDVAQVLKFDEKGVKVVSNIAELSAMLPSAIQKCLEYFAGLDRTLTGYEGLIAAQDCLPNDERRDAFASDFSVLSRIWEALSPDPVLTPHEKDYRWLAQVYGPSSLLLNAAVGTCWAPRRLSQSTRMSTLTRSGTTLTPW